MQQYQVSNDTDYTSVFMGCKCVVDDYYLYVQNTEFVLYRSTHTRARLNELTV